MNINLIVYDFPDAAYLIFGVLLLALLIWVLFSFRKKVLSSFAEPSLLVQLLHPRSQGTYWSKGIALCGVWILATLALMQPKGEARYVGQPEKAANEAEQTVTLRRKAHEVIFLIDASASMSVTDTREGETRLDNAKEIADQIANGLTGQMVILDAFTSVTTQLVSPTTDYVFLRLMIHSIQINEGDAAGTDFTQALTTISKEYFSKQEHLLKTLIIISDGGDNSLETLEGDAKERKIEAIASLLGNPESLNLRVFTVGVGSMKGGDIPNIQYEGKPVVSALEEDLLKKLAQAGRGSYYEANEYSVIDIAKDIIDSMGKDEAYIETTQQREGLAEGENNIIYDLYFQVPLGLAILLLGLVIVLPDSYRLRNPIQAKSFLFIVIMLFGFSSQKAWADLSARELVMLQAAAYFEAKDYNNAIDIYENMLQQNLETWEKAIVMYNLGCTYLAEGRWDQAIATFQAVPLNQNLASLVLRRIQTNIAVIYLRQALALSKQMSSKSPPDAVEENDQKMITLLQESLQSLDEANEAACSLAHVEGASACPMPYDLEEMRLHVKQLIASTFAQEDQFQLQHLNLEEGIPLLLICLKSTLANLDFLSQKDFEPGLQEKYFANFVDEAETWLPVWSNLESQVTKEEEKDKLFVEAQKSFQDTIQMLRVRNLPEARLGLARASEKLNALVQLIWGSNPWIEIVQMLISSYQRVLQQEPLQETTIRGLAEELDQIIRLPEKSPNPLVKETLDKVKQALASSLEALEYGYSYEGRAFFEEGLQELRRLFHKLSQPQGSLAENSLEMAIEEQQHALNLADLSLKIKEVVPGKKKIMGYLMNAQNQSLKIVEPFLQEVFAQQKKEFHEDIQPGKPDMRCQSQPWKEVLPLFTKGKVAAVKAKEFLTQNRPEFALPQQTETVKDWTEALEKMKNPTKTAHCQASLENFQQEEPKNPKESFDNVLRLLEQMTIDDALPQQPPPVLKKGLRSW